MPDDTIQEAGNRKEATRWTGKDKWHKVGKELRRGSRNGRCHPSQEKESHTKTTKRKRPRQRQRKRKQMRLSKTLKQ